MFKHILLSTLVLCFAGCSAASPTPVIIVVTDTACCTPLGAVDVRQLFLELLETPGPRNLPRLWNTCREFEADDGG